MSVALFGAELAHNAFDGAFFAAGRIIRIRIARLNYLPVIQPPVSLDNNIIMHINVFSNLVSHELSGFP